MKLAELKVAVDIFVRYECELNDVSAGHDELHLDGPAPDRLTSQECIGLEAAGWLWDEKFECWSRCT